MTTQTPATCTAPEPSPRTHGDQGSAVIEVAVLAPVFLVLLGFIVFVGRIGSLDQVVHSASRDGARAASLHRSESSARAAADEAIESTLTDQQSSCQNLRVDVDTNRLQPGGSVAVVVTCDVSLAGLSGFPLPGNKSVSARSVHVIDEFGVQGP